MKLSMIAKALTAISVFSYLFLPMLNEHERIRVAVYRGPAACEGCSESVKRALEKLNSRYVVDFVGPKEEIHISPKSLESYEFYVQPGGDQDTTAAFDSLGEDATNTIRQYVAQGGQYLGLCMGAYLADRDYIGLIEERLYSEVGRPGFSTKSVEDTAVPVLWNNTIDSTFYQDGPYFPANQSSSTRIIATYSNGDIAAVRYRHGAGVVVLSGPHPEADPSWFEEAGIPRSLWPHTQAFRHLIDALDL